MAEGPVVTAADRTFVNLSLPCKALMYRDLHFPPPGSGIVVQLILEGHFVMNEDMSISCPAVLRQASAYGAGGIFFFNFFFGDLGDVEIISIDNGVSKAVARIATKRGPALFRCSAFITWHEELLKSRRLESKVTVGRAGCAGAV